MNEEINKLLPGCCEEYAPKPRPFKDPFYGAFDWMMDDNETERADEDQPGDEGLLDHLGYPAQIEDGRLEADGGAAG